MIKAGRLRHAIIIEENTPTRGSAGGEVDVWTTFVERRAELTNKVGKEILSSGKLSGRRGVTFLLRYVAGVTLKMRVNVDSRTFNIVDVDNVKGLNKKLVITCVERI